MTKSIKEALYNRGCDDPINVQADSPTGNKETNIRFALASPNGWDIRMINVRNAYLQEVLNWAVYTEEPSTEEKKPYKIWKFN